MRTGVTLNLNGKTIENRVTNERLFHVYAPSFTVDGRTAGSAMVIPAGNAASYGFVKVCVPSTVTLDGGTYTGNTASGAFVKIFERTGLNASGSTVILNNLQATTNGDFFYTDTLNTPASTPTLRVEGGVYKTEGRAFGIDTIERSPVSFRNVTVTAETGPVVEVSGSAATFEDCNFQVTTTPPSDYYQSAVAVSYDGTADIKGGTYASTGYGIYVYSSGGTITVEDGVVQGDKAAARADVDDFYGKPSTVKIHGGEITGALETNENTKADIEVSGGIFDSDDVTAYVLPSVARDGAIVTFTSNGDTNYYVGPSEDVASSIASKAKANDVIKVLLGTINFSGGLPEGTVLTNEGGKLTVNGEVVQPGSTVIVHYVMPRTGDSSNVPLWLSLMALAAAGMGAAPVLMKKKLWAM